MPESFSNEWNKIGRKGMQYMQKLSFILYIIQQAANICRHFYILNNYISFHMYNYNEVKAYICKLHLSPGLR